MGEFNPQLPKNQLTFSFEDREPMHDSQPREHRGFQGAPRMASARAVMIGSDDDLTSWSRLNNKSKNRYMGSRPLTGFDHNNS